jgi:ABC-type phosphate/phosphonate transport system substrate-binding protein
MKSISMNRAVSRFAIALACCLSLVVSAGLERPSFAADAESTQPASSSSLTMVVMDPLAAPLACDCVQGYANRQYQRLAEALEARLDTKVQVYWTESLAKLQEKEPETRFDLVIGKDSVVAAQGKKLGLGFLPVASLTGKDGKTTQHGLFVVRAESSVASLIDLEGATIFFGPEECDEKWAAPRGLLETLEVKTASDSKVYGACSEAAKALMALPEDAMAAAVISSYAAPLLEGCGTINKGDLRIVGQTGDLPFVTAFVDKKLPQTRRDEIKAALIALRDKELLTVLESAKGFQVYDDGQ